jgi:hypothetical protein
MHFLGAYTSIYRAAAIKKCIKKKSALISASIQFDRLNLITGTRNLATLASGSPELVALKSV